MKPVKDVENNVYNFVKTDEEKKIDDLEQNLGDILFESASDKAKIRQMEDEQADLLFEIALLKAGGNI